MNTKKVSFKKTDDLTISKYSINSHDYISSSESRESQIFIETSKNSSSSQNRNIESSDSSISSDDSAFIY